MSKGIAGPSCGAMGDSNDCENKALNTTASVAYEWAGAVTQVVSHYVVTARRTDRLTDRQKKHIETECKVYTTVSNACAFNEIINLVVQRYNGVKRLCREALITSFERREL